MKLRKYGPMLPSVVKMTLAAILAILLATFLELEFAVSAGIIAILTIQPTKKETIRTAAGRLAAFVCALALAALSFWTMGFTLHAFFFYLAAFIFLCHTIRQPAAIAMDSVLVSHFLTFEAMGAGEIRNEILLFLLGVGVGIAANLHLHKRSSYMKRLREEADEQIRTILHRMSVRIVDCDLSDYNGACFHVLEQAIAAAYKMAEENYNNQFGTKDTFDGEYIQMREQQARVLYDMYRRVRRLQTKPITAQRISDYLARLAAEFHKENTGKALLEAFSKMDEEMKSNPLPASRAEFEDRAELYALLRDIEEFVRIKVEFADAR